VWHYRDGTLALLPMQTCSLLFEALSKARLE
jgi:hypothetical protein